MSKSIDVQLSQLNFPLTCVVCMSPASKHFGVEQIYTYGRKSYTVKVHVPMCEAHYAAASFKGTAEKLVGSLAVIGGIIAGIVAMIILILRWIGDGSLILKLFVGGIVGFGIFVLVWWIIDSFVAPRFAARESKEARNAVKITQIWPREQFARLKFENEQWVEMMQKGK